MPLKPQSTRPIHRSRLQSSQQYQSINKSIRFETIDDSSLISIKYPGGASKISHRNAVRLANWILKIASEQPR